MTIQVEASARPRPPTDWRKDPELAGLGTTYNQGVHVFDFLRYMLDADPIAVASLFDDEGTHDVETQSMSPFRFTNGTRGCANINQSVPHPQNDIAIYGTKGRSTGRGLTRSRFDGEMTVLDERVESTTSYPQPSGVAHRHNVAAFTHAVLSGEEPTASGNRRAVQHSALRRDQAIRQRAHHRADRLRRGARATQEALSGHRRTALASVGTVARRQCNQRPG